VQPKVGLAGFYNTVFEGQAGLTDARRQAEIIGEMKKNFRSTFQI
jgi:hypothetical protein